MSEVSALELHAGAGIGPLSLGMTRDAVRAALPDEPLRSRARVLDYQGTGITMPARDLFPRLRLRAEYRDDVCVALEVAAPADARLHGVAVLAAPFRQVLAWLAARDPALDVADDGCTSRALGIGLYAPDWRADPSVTAQGAIVFVDGYYELPTG